MAEYIKRDDVIQAIERYSLGNGSTLGYHSGAVDCAIQTIENMPAADVVPVRHAKWIPEEHEDRVSSTMTHKYTWYYCSECGRRLVGYSKLSDAPYCHCGARMDLKEESHDTEEE